MPTLLSEDRVAIEWRDIEARLHKRKHTTASRSSGLHLSGILKPVLIASGLLKPLDEKELLDDEMPLRMAIGMAWEDWSVGLWPGLIWQPGECSRDGITGSPDGISDLMRAGITNVQSAATVSGIHFSGGCLLEEFKATWKSRNTHGDVLKERIWLWQLSGYCKMLGVTFARLHVLWMNGSYRPPSPEYRTYLIEFRQEELDQFWTNVILKNKHLGVEESHE